MNPHRPDDARCEPARSSAQRVQPIAEVKEIEGLEHAFTPHFHEELQVAFVRTGRSRAVVHGHQLTAAAGSTVCIPPLMVHSCNPDHHSQWSYSLFLIHPVWLRSVEPSGRWEGSWVRPGIARTSPAELRTLAVVTDTWEDEPGGGEDAMIELCAALWDEGALDGRRDAEERGVGAPIACADEYLRENRSREVSLDELSTVSCLSKYHLVRSFKKAYGLSPHAYQLNLRINRARRLLSDGAPVVDVALDGGFSDQSHFTRVFARHVGMTPGAFRKQQYRTRTGSVHGL